MPGLVTFLNEPKGTTLVKIKVVTKLGELIERKTLGVQPRRKLFSEK